MATLREEAQAYVPPQTLNIAELDKVPVKAEVKSETHEGKDGEFTVQYIEVDTKKYRVPASVLKGIKGLLLVRPDLEYVQVLKDGTGMNTTYQVIPYDEVKQEEIKG